MMVADASHNELQLLASHSSPPQLPSGSASPSQCKAESSMSLLRHISEMDQSSPVEEAMLKTGGCSLKLQRTEGRNCIGLALGVLVPTALAALVLFRSSGMSPHSPLDDYSTNSHSNATRESKQNDMLFGSALQEELNVSTNVVQVSNLLTHAKTTTNGQIVGSNLTLGGDSQFDSSISTRVEEDQSIMDDGAPSHMISSVTVLHAQTDVQPLVEQPRWSKGSPALRGAVTSVPHTRIPWYFYFGCAFSVATGAAWIALAASNCRSRAC